MDVLIAAKGEGGESARLIAVRCLLVAPEFRLPRGIGFQRVLQGMTTLSIVATLDGWTEIKRQLQVAARDKAEGYMDIVIAGLKAWRMGGEAAAAGIQAASTALGGCATAWELENLRSQGLVDCGIDPSTYKHVTCQATCVPTPLAMTLLVPFIIIAQVCFSMCPLCEIRCIIPNQAACEVILCVMGGVQFVMFQLVLASILQILRDPFSKVHFNYVLAFKIQFYSCCEVYQV